MKEILSLNQRRALACAPSVLKATLGSLVFCMLISVPVFAQKASAKPQPQNKSAPKSQGAQKNAALVYSCPMHPSVKSGKADKCPKCGMQLRPVEHKDASAATTAGANASTSGATEETSGRGTSYGQGKLVVPDIELLNQDGQKVRFYTDLVKNKVVAINFIFTTCTTICPPLGATFARVQKDLGERVGRDVHFISVSVDPLVDTPERLKAWGAKFRAGAGWTFVTGDKQQVDQLLRGLAASASRREDHSPSVLIINDAKGTSTRTYGLAKPSQLVKIIEDAINGTNTTTAAAVKE